MTLRLPTTPEAIAQAAALIQHDGLVAFPTETVYGLGANALSARAAARIFAAKQRALNDPLIVHLATIDDLARVADLSALTTAQTVLLEKLATAFWPGPLTLVLPKRPEVPQIVSAGLASVAVRVPDHPVALALLRASGLPIAAPSANLFGHVSPTTAQHVLDDLDGRIDAVIDGGATRIGVESTVLNLLGDAPEILRPGGVARERITALGIAVQPAQRHITRAAGLGPGLLESHYAPRAELRLLSDTQSLIAQHADLTARGARCGLLITQQQAHACRALHPQYVLGDTPEAVARALYAGLRALDDSGVAPSCAHNSRIPRTASGRRLGIGWRAQRGRIQNPGQNPVNLQAAAVQTS